MEGSPDKEEDEETRTIGELTEEECLELINRYDYRDVENGSDLFDSPGGVIYLPGIEATQWFDTSAVEIDLDQLYREATGESAGSDTEKD